MNTMIGPGKKTIEIKMKDGRVYQIDRHKVAHFIATKHSERDDLEDYRSDDNGFIWGHEAPTDKESAYGYWYNGLMSDDELMDHEIIEDFDDWKDLNPDLIRIEFKQLGSCYVKKATYKDGRGKLTRNYDEYTIKSNWEKQ